MASDINFAEGAILSAVYSRGSGKAQDFADRHSGVIAFDSLTSMINSHAIDAVYVATPNMTHHAKTLECIAAGMPVLIEKPMTASLDEALEIQSAASDKGSFVMEAMWSRYLPAIKAVRSALGNGVIGTVRKLEADIAKKHEFNPESRFFDKQQCGGALHDLGVYPISLARYFLSDPDSIEAIWHAAPSGVDMAADIHLKFDRATAEITCGFDRDGLNRMVIEGDKGVLVLAPPFIKADSFSVYPSRRLADLAKPGRDAMRCRTGSGENCSTTSRCRAEPGTYADLKATDCSLKSKPRPTPFVRGYAKYLTTA